LDAELLVGLLSTFVLDYFSRLKVSGNHLTQGILATLPVPGREDVRGFASSALGDPSWFEKRTLELVNTAYDLEAFAEECGWLGPPFRWDDERRFLLRCEMDAAFFHLYLPAEADGDWWIAEGETAQDLARLKASLPTPRDAVGFIMDSFPIVRRKDEDKYDGDFRTRRVILEIYDAMQESIRAGQTYFTRLDPPPADPRCCHPPLEQARA